MDVYSYYASNRQACQPSLEIQNRQRNLRYRYLKHSMFGNAFRIVHISPPAWSIQPLAFEVYQPEPERVELGALLG